MKSHDFLFTYSVSKRGDDENDNADKVRRKIADLDQWEKLEGVETAFVGSLSLAAYSIQDKREEAKNCVKGALMDIVDGLDAYQDVWINVAILVDGLGKCIEFKF